MNDEPLARPEEGSLLAEQAVAKSRELDGPPLDYSAASVEPLNRWLGRFAAPHETTEGRLTTARQFGSYLGEVVVRQYGGQWVPIAGTELDRFGLPFGLVIRLPSGVCFSPHGAVLRRLQDDTRDVSEYYRWVVSGDFEAWSRSLVIPLMSCHIFDVEPPEDDDEEDERQPPGLTAAELEAVMAFLESLGARKPIRNEGHSITLPDGSRAWVKVKDDPADSKEHQFKETTTIHVRVPRLTTRLAEFVLDLCRVGNLHWTQWQVGSPTVYVVTEEARQRLIGKLPGVELALTTQEWEKLLAERWVKKP